MKNFKTVEKARKIRNVNYEKLKEKSHSERIAFYRKKAQLLHNEIIRLTQKDGFENHLEARI